MTAALKPTQWQPGKSANPGGRPKKLLARVEVTLHQAGKDPVEEILKLLPKLAPALQLKAWLELLTYVQAKPKPEVDEGNPLTGASVEELVAIIRERNPDLVRLLSVAPLPEAEG